MAQYIDKAAIVAEIEKMLQNEYPCDNLEQGTGYSCALYELQDFLDTLEVKEVGEPSNDLKKEIQETQCMKSIKEKVEELYRIPRGDDTEDTVALDLEKAVAFTEGAYYVIEEIGKVIYKVIDELKK